MCLFSNNKQFFFMAWIMWRGHTSNSRADTRYCHLHHASLPSAPHLVSSSHQPWDLQACVRIVTEWIRSEQFGDTRNSTEFDGPKTCVIVSKSAEATQIWLAFLSSWVHLPHRFRSLWTQFSQSHKTTTEPENILGCHIRLESESCAWRFVHWNCRPAPSDCFPDQWQEAGRRDTPLFYKHLERLSSQG